MSNRIRAFGGNKMSLFSRVEVSKENEGVRINRLVTQHFV
jgi:hypothetical protein